VKSGNSAAVAVWRIDRRRVRDRVDGSDKEQQTHQPDGIFIFQRVLEQEEAIPLASIPFHGNNNITFGAKMQNALSQPYRFEIPPDRGLAPEMSKPRAYRHDRMVRCSAAEFEKTGKDRT
jgi:hypothetical protein